MGDGCGLHRWMHLSKASKGRLAMCTIHPAICLHPNVKEGKSGHICPQGPKRSLSRAGQPHPHTQPPQQHPPSVCGDGTQGCWWPGRRWAWRGQCPQRAPSFQREPVGERSAALSFPDKAMAAWGSGWLHPAGLRGKGTGRDGEAKEVVTSPSSRSALNKLEERRGEVVCSVPG